MGWGNQEDIRAWGKVVKSIKGIVPILPEMTSASLPQRPASSQRKSSTSNLGNRAEQLVGQWLTSAGWELLVHRWHCRWGELDWVALSPAGGDRPQELVFVEVKARRRANWDADGLLAITPKKQAKLWQAAELFLMAHPHLAELPCRFDVVLVGVKPTSRPSQDDAESLIIQHHIPNAFGYE